MADGTTPMTAPSSAIAPPAQAVTPGGINHLVINVRDIEESHRFWTEMLGFKEVGRLSRRNMRFYSGDHGGQLNHHDIALVENPNLPKPPADWQMFDMPVAINHIAITMPNREAWLKQIAWLRQNGVSDPNGYGVEVLYELPREVWGGDIQAALDHVEGLPTEGEEAFVDDTRYPRFGKEAPPPAE
jgi:catechol 2,3-dioxygenase